MVSIALVVVAAVSFVLIAFAVGAVLVTARGTAEADSALARRVAAGRAARASGDLHLFLRYPEPVARELLASIGEGGRVSAEDLGAAIERLRAAFPEATDAHASYSRFHFIRCRHDERPGTTIYVAVRTRVAVETVVDASDRGEWERTFATLAALPPDAVVTALIAEAESDRDPASPALVPLRSASSSA